MTQVVMTMQPSSRITTTNEYRKFLFNTRFHRNIHCNVQKMISSLVEMNWFEFLVHSRNLGMIHNVHEIVILLSVNSIFHINIYVLLFAIISFKSLKHVK